MKHSDAENRWCAMTTIHRIDWNAHAARAASLTDAMLHAELADLLGTLDSADTLDRETGDDRGGFYRDVCSVLRKELADRESGRRRVRLAKELVERIRAGRSFADDVPAVVTFLAEKGLA